MAAVTVSKFLDPNNAAVNAEDNIGSWDLPTPQEEPWWDEEYSCYWPAIPGDWYYLPYSYGNQGYGWTDRLFVMQIEGLQGQTEFGFARARLVYEETRWSNWHLVYAAAHVNDYPYSYGTPQAIQWYSPVTDYADLVPGDSRLHDANLLCLQIAADRLTGTTIQQQALAAYSDCMTAAMETPIAKAKRIAEAVAAGMQIAAAAAVGDWLTAGKWYEDMKHRLDAGKADGGLWRHYGWRLSDRISVAMLEES